MFPSSFTRFEKYGYLFARNWQKKGKAVPFGQILDDWQKKGKAVPFGQILDACGGKFRGLAELLFFSPKAFKTCPQDTYLIINC
jgi:hypothetical protein